MDIRDLQYGDLVLVNGTVNRVGYDLLHQMTAKDHTTWEIKGLPLTAEFLEANGFNDLNKGLKKSGYARYLSKLIIRALYSVGEPSIWRRIRSR